MLALSATKNPGRYSVGLFLRNAGESWHRLMACCGLSARIYFSLIPHFSRRMGRKAQQRLRNSINAVTWPNITLGARAVLLGNNTKVVLHPHFQEFDLEAVLSSSIHYEREVFVFLESRITNYRSVIEI